MVDMLPLAGQRRLHRQRLHIDIGLHQGGQLRRQRADLRRLDAVLVHETGHFHAAVRGRLSISPCWRTLP